jgi:hypothetical protein
MAELWDTARWNEGGLDDAGRLKPKKVRPAPGGEPAATNPVWGRGGVGT